MFLNVSGDWIYYCNNNDNSRIYKIKTDGTGKAEITDSNAMWLNIEGDWIYYCNITDDDSVYGKIYKIKTDGTGEMEFKKQFKLNL